MNVKLGGASRLDPTTAASFIAHFDRCVVRIIPYYSGMDAVTQCYTQRYSLHTLTRPIPPSETALHFAVALVQAALVQNTRCS